MLTKDAGECVICLEELLQGDTIARLPCLCIYHKRYEGAGRPGSATPTPEGSFPVVGGESQPSGGPWAASKQRPARGDVWTCGAQSRGGLWIPGPLEGWVCVCLHEPPLLRSVQTLVCAAGPARRALLAASAPGPAPRPGGSSQAPPLGPRPRPSARRLLPGPAHIHYLWGGALHNRAEIRPRAPAPAFVLFPTGEKTPHSGRHCSRPLGPGAAS